MSAKDRLRVIYPHLVTAFSIAKRQVPDGTVHIAIMGQRPDGSGEVVCSLECEEFLKDLQELLWGEELEKQINTPLTSKPITGFQLLFSKKEETE